MWATGKARENFVSTIGWPARSEGNDTCVYLLVGEDEDGATS